MDIILMPGLWLKSTAWDEVAAELRKLGHNPIQVKLPGTDDESTTVTLEDQIEAAVEAVDGADRPMVVGHSAASALAWVVADRRPEKIHSAVMVGGFPPSNGSEYASFFEIADGVMPFPGWEPFAGPDSDDLDEAARERIAAESVPVPGGVAEGIVNLTEERRYEVPVVMVCPEYSVEDAKGWVEEGEIPELAKATSLSYVDIDSGHWPMFSKPDELAAVLDGIAR